MRKIILLITIFICIFQVEAFADTEFIRGNAPKIEETRIDTADNFFYAKIFNVNGIPYIYKGFKTNPVPYDESLSEIFDKNYIITDNYYIAHEYTNRAAISGGAYVPFTTLLIYDKQMNLLHEENFGGGVCVYDVGYCNGVIYCEYAEKLEEVFENGSYHFERSYNPCINRNSSREKIEWVTVKSTDMINWEKCEEDIPVSNSRVSILGDKISLFEKNPVNVAYENNEEYKLNNAQIKLGDWFLVGGIVQGKHFLSNIYLTNDFVYFVPINIPEEATEAFNENQVNVLGEVYEYDDKIILNYENLKYYLIIPTGEVYSKLNEIKNAPYVRLKDNILGFETPPVIENGSMLVPMRFLFEQMGADVEWNQETQTATATLDNKAVTFSIDNVNARINNKSAKMDVPARLVNGKTMVPLRFLSENMGYDVDWDADSRTAIIKDI